MSTPAPPPGASLRGERLPGGAWRLGTDGRNPSGAIESGEIESGDFAGRALGTGRSADHSVGADADAFAVEPHAPAGRFQVALVQVFRLALSFDVDGVGRRRPVVPGMAKKGRYDLALGNS
ncbi:hypothetical protein ACFS5L_35040 [Streptomyces phyllanthi]|uniref:Uncharacterized protein n=1 Tax=Streptomyces phyllanthi TaxID=1803180 RepID=A0A5N8W8P1_9ACTN|nr:hypothetical protein [Streptomyces phyllanthi]MPY42788.1 hypothetical protein [Streptomyces phyllanthi]